MLGAYEAQINLSFKRGEQYEPKKKIIWLSNEKVLESIV